MTSAPPARTQTVDWESWHTALEQFAAASGLVVSAYDADGARRVGPVLVSRISQVLSESSLWQDDGPGTRLERQLAARCIETGQDQTDTFCNELHVHATPVMRHGVARGALVFGWNFRTFATGQGCGRLAKSLDIPVAKLWAMARLEVPVSDARKATYVALLRTMIDFTTRQAEVIDRLNELSRMREVFLASVSHEMRTPLAAISLRLEMLLHGSLDDPEAVRSALQAMSGHVTQEEKLIEDLIDAARTRTGQLQIAPVRVSLRRVLDEAMATIEPKARIKRIDLSMLISGDADETDATGDSGDAHVWGDPQRLQQVFWNILSNAVKFTPEGGGVRIELLRGPQTQRVRIRDTGMGIAPAQLPYVFDAFTKQEMDNVQGLGLGLSISKHIVELHGGSIGVASEGLNQGTVFTVSLPIHRENDAPTP